MTMTDLTRHCCWDNSSWKWFTFWDQRTCGGVNSASILTRALGSRSRGLNERRARIPRAKQCEVRSKGNPRSYMSTYMSSEIESRESPSLARFANSHSSRCLSQLSNRRISLRKQKTFPALHSDANVLHLWIWNRGIRRRDSFPFFSPETPPPGRVKPIRENRIGRREFSAIGLRKRS